MTPEPRSVFVEPGGVRLHCLLWGDEGDPLLLLPGLGHSAHVFRELAPALAADRRVAAVTPRAHGASATPGDGYTVAGLAAELRGAMDELGMERAALVAHSFAGVVATRLAADHPERVSHVVYLDGIVDYAGRDPVVVRNPFPPPSRPLLGDAFQQREWLRRYVPGFWCEALEADLAARAPAVEEIRRLELLYPVMAEAAAHPPPFGALCCPALALVAAESVESHFGWLDPADAAARRRAEEYLWGIRLPWRRAAVERFRREARQGRVVEVPGGHYFFLSARDRVADEIRAFLLPPAPPDP